VSDFGAALTAAFGPDRVGRSVSVAPFTTFRVGGPADWLIETRSSGEILAALRIAHSFGMAVTMLGGGSNVLVSDAGIRGLVIRTRGGVVSKVSAERIEADAALSINGLVRWAVAHGCAGLEAWAGTPGTVGGAIFGNAHFGKALMGDQISHVRLATRAGDSFDVTRDEMAFGYDRSRVQDSGEVVLSAVFRVAAGDPAMLRATARQSLAFRKRTQPLDSRNAGCVFRNPESAVGLPDGVPPAAGALVDLAGLKGSHEGGATVSALHGNFIINEGYASARDIRRLIVRCQEGVRRRFGVTLREEIVYLGRFDD
jgi:UDP-N-acetylmuramate dehydrogenase